MGLFGGSNLVEPVRGYQYQSLSEEEKKIYDTLAEGIAAFQKKISIRYPGEESFKKTMRAVELDNPQFFYFNKKKIEVMVSSLGAAVLPQYIYDRKTAEGLRDKIESAAGVILQNHIRPEMSEYEKVVAVHDSITRDTMYNFSALTASIAFDAHSIVGPFLKHSGVCEGIAKSIAFLLMKLNIPVLCVSGSSEIDGNSVGHMWNMVELEGEYYHLDATWDLQEINHFSSQSHVYVLLDDDAMLESHEWEVNDYPICCETKNNYYVKEGRYYKTKRAFELFIAKCVEEKKNFIDVRFSDTMTMPDSEGRWAVNILQDTAGRCGLSVRTSYGYMADSCILQMNAEYF